MTFESHLLLSLAVTLELPALYAVQIRYCLYYSVMHCTFAITFFHYTESPKCHNGNQEEESKESQHQCSRLMVGTLSSIQATALGPKVVRKRHIVNVFYFCTCLGTTSDTTLLCKLETRHKSKHTLDGHSPVSELALPPLVAAASKDVPRTENTFTFSSHFTVQIAFPEIYNLKQQP